MNGPLRLIHFNMIGADLHVERVSLTELDRYEQLSAMGGWAGDLVLLSDCHGGSDLQRCDVALGVVEARSGRPAASMKIIACVESAAGLMQVSTLNEKSGRLAGIAWNSNAFFADMKIVPDTLSTDHVRLQIAVVARACGVPFYETAAVSAPSVRARFKDCEGA